MVVALLLSTIVLGLISRTLPQINIIAVGFNLNALLTLGMIFVSLGVAAWTFQEPAIEVMSKLQEALGSG